MKFRMICSKYEPRQSSLSEVMDSEGCAYLNVQQGFFLKAFGSERVKYSQKPLKPPEK